MRKARKNYSPQEKMAILRRHLLDKVSILHLCAEFQLRPTVFYRWLKQFFDNGAAALRRKPTAGKQPDSRQRGIAVTQGQLTARESREAEQQWMISLTQGRFGSEQVRRAIGDSVSQEDIDKLLGCVRNEPLKYRKRAVAVLSYHRLIRVGHVAGFLGVSHSSVDDWVRRFAQHGCRLLLPFKSEYCKAKDNTVHLRNYRVFCLAGGQNIAMARTLARLPTGSRVTDYISLGVVSRAIPREKIDSILASTGKASVRQRELPAHLVVYYVIALALYMQSSYREVLRCLLEGIQWLTKPEETVRATCGTQEFHPAPI